MRHTLPIAPQFYVTAPQPCPYLEGRMERKLFTALQGEAATRLNDSLSGQGFRRSQNVLYRPSCADCSACLSARINVADFVASKSQKRTIKRNSGLLRRATSPWATEDQYELFRRYLDSRHADGGMADMATVSVWCILSTLPTAPRPGWGITSSLTILKSPGTPGCLMSTLAIGCRAVRKWGIRPNSRGLRCISAALGKRFAAQGTFRRTIIR